jgi:preprotein translocase subunit SecF
MELLRNVNIDWMGKQKLKLYLALSTAALAICIASMTPMGNGIPLGVDFNGGTIVYVRFSETTSPDQIRAAVEKAGIKEARIQRYDKASEHKFIIATEQKQLSESSLDASKQQIITALQNSPLAGKFEVFNTEIVGPQVGEQLQWQAFWATVYSLTGMLVYLWFRFELIYGAAAVAAVIHDTVFTLGVFSLTNTELSLTVIAALLTLIGYSMNDTIVIFDRIRENLKLSRRESITEIVNRSINQTLSRTILTSGLTFLTVAALFFFGGPVLHGFSFALVVGILIGTYSSIAVAAPLVVVYQDWSVSRRSRRSVESANARKDKDKVRA